MQFFVSEEVFAQFPNICIGVVIAESIDNVRLSERIGALLQQAAGEAYAALNGTDVKAHPAVAVWRDAFSQLGLNPNKYPSSIEALAKRLSKRPELPRINNVVDLVNAMAVRHLVPMGAHDIDRVVGELAVRFTGAGEKFTPFGETEAETVDEHELVYTDAEEVRTRKWVWRQGEKAKVTEATRNVFFPIDGFYGATETNVRAAQADLAAQLTATFPDCAVRQYWIDCRNSAVALRKE